MVRGINIVFPRVVINNVIHLWKKNVINMGRCGKLFIHRVGICEKYYKEFSISTICLDNAKSVFSEDLTFFIACITEV
jgi:hypothetical protein